MKKSYFLNLTIEELNKATYAILPGDPERSKELAFALNTHPVKLKHHRHHLSYLIDIEGKKVLIVSTGMGGPAIAATVSELYSLGIKNFIRIGTCGTIQENVQLGDLVLSRAAIKFDGLSQSFLDEGFPALPSFSLTDSIQNAAAQHGVPHHVGITVSSDTFWPGQERYDNYSGYLLSSLRGNVDMWRNHNVTNIEMEGAALFTIATFLNVRSACLCGVIAKRTDSEELHPRGKELSKKYWEAILKDALIIDMKKTPLQS